MSTFADKFWFAAFVIATIVFLFLGPMGWLTSAVCWIKLLGGRRG